jgi:ABC-2 type transport system permease protein
VAVLAVLCLLTVFAVGRGLNEVARQNAVISHLQALQKTDLSDLAKTYGPEGDAGYIAYYGFFHTYDPPSSLAFVALGQRDVLPYNLRVRALGLQAQLYEGDNFNPELALPGRFDPSFVVIYLTPLFLIVLLHDLVSHEKESGRLGLLRASPGAGIALWLRRALLRAGLAFLAVALPLIAGCLISTAPLAGTIAILALVLLYIGVWTGLCVLVASFRADSRRNALVLLSLWVATVLIAPVATHLAITRAIPVPQGVNIVPKHRQAVHGAWEVPKALTMQRFVAYHPEWKDTPPLGKTFEWKWYFAFHHVGDQFVADDAAAYRASISNRQALARTAGFVLPSVGMQTALERIADTDIDRYLGYQMHITDFHTALRHFYYPYIFNVVPFHEPAFSKTPRFDAKPYSGSVDIRYLLALFVLTGGIWLMGILRMRNSVS